MDKTKHKITAAAGLFILAVVVFVIIWLNRPDCTAAFTGFAMDTVISVKVYGGKDPDECLTPLNQIFSDTEQMISRHREGSYTEQLNTGETLRADNSYLTLLQKNLELWEETDGLFDITSGPLIDLWHIGSGNETVPDAAAIEETLKKVSGSRIRIQGDTVSLEPGTLIDLGASGKGFVLDRIRAYLSETDLKGACISAGGSVLLYGTHDRKKDYTVAVQHPDDSTAYLGLLALADCTVSTSGDYERCFFADGKRYHHILSPDTGYPAETGLRSVTVVSEDGTMSDILSTAVFLVGKEQGLELLSAHHAEGILVSEDHTVTVTAGLRDSFRLTAEGYTLEIYEGLSETR